MNALRRLLPASDEGISVAIGLAMVAGGFFVAELLQSILYAPLGLIVPGLFFVFLPFLPAREGDQ